MDDIQKVLMSGPLQITLNEGEYGLEAKYFNKVRIDRDKDGYPSFSKEISDLIIKAEQWVNKAFEKARQRENNPYPSQTNNTVVSNSEIDEEIPF